MKYPDDLREKAEVLGRPVITLTIDQKYTSKTGRRFSGGFSKVVALPTDVELKIAEELLRRLGW